MKLPKLTKEVAKQIDSDYQEFLTNTMHVRYSSTSQPSYTCGPNDNMISNNDFLLIKERIANEVKLGNDIASHYDLIEEYIEFYKNNPQYSSNSLGLYISYFIQRMSYRTMFDKRLIHLFVRYLKIFHPIDDVARFWIIHDKALRGDIGAAKELAMQYWDGRSTPDRDYKKCEYFALISIKNNDRYALFNYAMYLMDIKKGDVDAMRYSLKTFLDEIVTSRSDEEYLTILEYISILLCDRSVELDCYDLLIKIKDFIYDNYPKRGLYWTKEKMDKILSNIGGVFYHGRNVKKNYSLAKEILPKTSSNYKAVFYLGSINNPNNSILDSKYAAFRVATNNIKINNIKNIRYCDCKNAYEYKSLLLCGDCYFTEEIEQSDRHMDLLETWSDLYKKIGEFKNNSNLIKLTDNYLLPTEESNESLKEEKLNNVFKDFVKEKLC